MIDSNIQERYLANLLTGDRSQARQIVSNAVAEIGSRQTLAELCWPAMETVRGLYREHKLSRAQLNLATRLNRSMVDRLGGDLEHAPVNGKTVIVFCGDDEPEELGGQMCADLFEAEGWDAKFAGGGVPNDEVLEMIGRWRPDMVVMFASLGSNLPQVRALIDHLRDVNCCPEMQVMCAGGVYQRAEGLAEEIGADLWADNAEAAVALAAAEPGRKATVAQQTVGKMRRIRQQQESERAMAVAA
jgi:methanogenic corrinoid protein MtbC1